MTDIKLDEDGNLNVSMDFFLLMDSMSSDQKVELIERLSCEDEIIQHVADQILSGCTENGYSGSEVIDEYRLSTPLQKARENIRKKGNRLLIKEIERLRVKLEDKNNHYESGWNAYHELNNKMMGR